MNLIKLFYVPLLIFSSCTTRAQQIDKEIIERIESIKEGFQFSENTWLITEQEDTVSFSKLKGEWTILDYWSAGCKPCIKAFPILKALTQQDSIKLSVIAINVDNSFSRFKKFSKKYDIGYPNYFGGFTLSNPLFLPVTKVIENEDGKSVITLTPQYVLINPDGVIVNVDLSKPGSREFYEEIRIISR